MVIKNKLKNINVFILIVIILTTFSTAPMICIDRTGPSAPINLNLIESNGEVQLSWDSALDSPSCSWVDYDIYRSFNDGDFVLIQSEVSGNNYNDAVETNGFYTYIIHTVDAPNHYDRNGISGTIEVTNAEPVDHMAVAVGDITCEGMSGYLYEETIIGHYDDFGRCYNSATGDHMLVNRGDTTCENNPGYIFEKDMRLSSSDFGRCVKGAPPSLNKLSICCYVPGHSVKQVSYHKDADISIPLSPMPTSPYTEEGTEIYREGEVIFRIGDIIVGTSIWDQFMYFSNGYDQDGYSVSISGSCEEWSGHIIENLAEVSDSATICYLKLTQ